MITKVSDRIETLVHFQNGRIKPIRFLWNNHSYKVDSITTNHQIKDAGATKLAFSVQSSGNLYQLLYNPSDHTWTLQKIHTDG